MKCPHCGKDISAEFAAIGGRARAAKLTDARRSEIARKAAAARWKRKPSQKKAKP